MDNEIKRVYSGSVVDAVFIGSVLADNGIQFLIRNFQEESLVAGWAAGVIQGDASVFVFEKDYDKAMLLLDEINAAEMEVSKTAKASESMSFLRWHVGEHGIYAF